MTTESLARNGKGTAKPQSSQQPFTREKLFLYTVLTVVIALILVAVFWFAVHVSSKYDATSNAALSAYQARDLLAGDAMVYAFAFSRARDAAVVKGGGLLLSFLVVVLGTMVVLKGTEALYGLRIEDAQRKSALETSSPGLVMITLGLLLAYGIISHKTEISFFGAREGDTLASGGKSSSASAQAPSGVPPPSDSLPAESLDPNHAPLPSGSRP